MPATDLIKGLNSATLEKIAGVFRLAQPSPHETIPNNMPFETKGPPESPLHASFIPSGKPAQIIFRVMELPK